MAKLSAQAIHTRGALVTYLSPRLATDAKIDYSAVVAGLTAKNFTDQRPTIESRLRAATRGHMAQDADIEDLVELLDRLEDDKVEDAEMMTDPNAAVPARGTEEGEDGQVVDLDKVKELLAGQVSPEVLASLDALAGSADETPEEIEKREREKSAADARKRLGRDETPDEIAEREKQEKAAADARRAKDSKVGKDGDPAMKPEYVSQAAMDAALAANADAVTKRVRTETMAAQRAIRTAENEVRPWVGEMPNLAADSAEDVYRGALKALNFEGSDDLPGAALRPVLMAQPKPTARRDGFAQDALPSGGKPASDFNTRFPNAKRIGLA